MDAERHMKKLDEEYRKETYLRKKYFNDIQDMKGKIRVLCRVRPLSKKEPGDDDEKAATDQDGEEDAEMVALGLGDVAL